MKKAAKPLKKFPILKTDEEAEAFIENSDLTEYDLSELKPVRFELRRKEARINMRLPEELLQAVKSAAKQHGIPYQRYIRQVLEQALPK
ncbi:MAG TPA: BrnA antitoxin family protein [Steroidobacteraceae bacterium]|nr:BrnA antitoxin family protein [Steroidobacteraceae bacterium]